MAKDKRVKGCPNQDCERNYKKYHYKASDKYCTLCGEELLFVCPVCFTKLADLGMEHVMCSSCSADKEDRKHDIKKRVRNIGNKVSDAASSGAKVVKNGAVSAAHAVKDGAEIAAKVVKEKMDKGD